MENTFGDTFATGRSLSVAVIGAGQLARMLCQPAVGLGIEVTVLTDQVATNGEVKRGPLGEDGKPIQVANTGAVQVAPNFIFGSPSDPEALRTLSAHGHAMTFEHELIDADVIEQLEAEGDRFRPSSGVLRIAQNKLLQRRRFAELGLPLPAWQQLNTAADLESFGEQHGWPLVIKSASGGYDGRGVWVVGDLAEATAVVSDLQAAGIDVLLEQCVAIEREFAIQVARNPSGEMVSYPLVETVQQGGICREVTAPAQVAPELSLQAKEIGLTIAQELDVAGMLAVELFECGGELLVNEIAARPHNSGHYSIEGCLTSQFENHLRAVLDLPLGNTQLTAPVVVSVNLLGGERPFHDDDYRAALAIPGLNLHLYGKEHRPGRKLGHVTVLSGTADEARQRCWQAVKLLGMLPMSDVEAE